MLILRENNLKSSIFYLLNMILHKYNPNWIHDFAKVKEKIVVALWPLKVSILHVGSTSVPGLSAKAIIDMDLVYYSNIDFEEIKNGLEKIGYFHNGNQGIDNREVFKRKKGSNLDNMLDVINHHLYVCPEESKELERHLLFRDYLISNTKARLQYQNIKIQLAKEAGQDRKVYAELKELEAKEFINDCILKAKTF
jgi:GrpB-like predicted nucleotidyltransferase (UPF0157 family)